MPPTINHYYGRRGSRTFLTKRAFAFIKATWAEFHSKRRKKLVGALRMRVWIYPPDRRRRDLDNCLKGLQDAMERAGVFENDYQITDIHMTRGEPFPLGKSVVELTEIR